MNSNQNAVKRALKRLKDEIEQEDQQMVLDFKDFLELVRANPYRLLRNIFQLFHDMVCDYIGKGVNEYPDDPESIGYVKYDCSKLFVKEADKPFFADRLFANRFIKQVKSLRRGSRQNQLHVYLGPHGCGKSTFVNNVFRSFETYTSSEEGRCFEVFWKIKINGKQLEIPCPSHDHPLLIVPRGKCRERFLRDLLPADFWRQTMAEKEYEWLRKREACTICNSLFWALLDKLSDPDLVWQAIKARLRIFSRRIGEGISVFNPGDRTMKPAPPEQIQQQLDEMFGVGRVKYVFSQLAKTNNGIYVLMDIKGRNKPRLAELHNVITEGVHRVDSIEEQITSLFIALMNPEDKDALEGHETERFEGRIQEHRISYVLEVPTEVKIYHSVFGEKIDRYFLPKVLENFARVIIASRMHDKCEPLAEWIEDLEKYERYCDEAGLLLRMEIYSGIIPDWLSEEDRKKFTAKVRRKLIAYGEKEGGKEGFDGRESIKLFGDFLSRYEGRGNCLINMAHLVDYFKHKMNPETRDEMIPLGFLDSLVNWYDYTVLNEVKESLYFYNEERIREDILNYLCAINYQPDGSCVKCVYTGKEVKVTVDFFKTMGMLFAGEELNDEEAVEYAEYIQERYARALSRRSKEGIAKTELFQELFEAYARNLKERVLQPFLENESFWDAVKAFPEGEEYKAIDARMKECIVHLIKNLTTKFDYTEQGAKEVCLYVKDKKLAEKFAA